MKVLFLKDVPKIGKKGEVKDVADGFAYNNLIPRKLAAPATAENVKRAEQSQAATVHARAQKTETVRMLAERTKETPLMIEVSANAQGHLFKGLRAQDVIVALKAQFGAVLDEKDVALAQPIKEAGIHEVPVHGGDFRGSLHISITPLSK